MPPPQKSFHCCFLLKQLCVWNDMTTNIIQTYRLSKTNLKFWSDKGFSCSSKYLVNDFVSFYLLFAFCLQMVDLFSGVWWEGELVLADRMSEATKSVRISLQAFGGLLISSASRKQPNSLRYNESHARNGEVSKLCQPLQVLPAFLTSFFSGFSHETQSMMFLCLWSLRCHKHGKMESAVTAEGKNTPKRFGNS